MVYTSSERSIDLCPLDHIDSANSTVTISISTDSPTDIEISIRVRVKGRGIDWIQTSDSKYNLIETPYLGLSKLIPFQWNLIH